MGLCAERDLFENSLGKNSKNSLRSMKTDSERLEELRLDSLKERKLRRTETYTESNTEKPVEENKGNNLFSMPVADRTSNGPKSQQEFRSDVYYLR